DLFQETVGRGIHHLPAERLQAELELFVKTGVAEVRVLDPAFNFPPERGQRLLRLLAERAPGLRYILEARADFLDRETVRLLSQLACSVRLDLISARPEVLRLLHRTFDPELFASQIHLLASEGVDFSLALFWGLQGDNLEGFRQSLDWALSLAPQRLDLFPQPDHPGHLLYRHRAEFGLIPTRSEGNRGESAWSLPELETCRHLAAATDLFYNQGRAAPFFGPLLQATNSRPALFLEEFAAWATGPGQVEEARFFSAADWPAEEILLLQENYLTCRLRQLERSDLVAAAVDLIRFHYHHTQMQAEPETTPLSPESLQGLDLWETRWRKAPQARLVAFSYEVLGLQECRDINLEDFASLFRPVGSVAIFLRRDGMVLCESLAESFLRLLQESNGERSPREIFSGSISRQEGEEIVECAVEEGFLVRA
ncbi:MAG: hypothetical protein IH614_13155, partial [Desulfuromonadales bacterium]|nr:hypothetical protein [Desulfuromonadales bacterium]